MGSRVRRVNVARLLVGEHLLQDAHLPLGFVEFSLELVDARVVVAILRRFGIRVGSFMC